MAKVKPIGHIWGLEFNRYVCFSFSGNRTTFGWDIANSIFDLENSRSRSWPRSHLMVTFEAWGSIDMFAFRFVAIGPFLAEIWEIPYLTLKFQGQGHGQGFKVKPGGHIWGLEINQYVCFSFRGNRTIFGKFHIQGQGHDENRPKSNQVIYRSWPTIVPKMKEIEKVVQKLSHEQESAAAAGGSIRTGTKT